MDFDGMYLNLHDVYMDFDDLYLNIDDVVFDYFDIPYAPWCWNICSTKMCPKGTQML